MIPEHTLLLATRWAAWLVATVVVVGLPGLILFGPARRRDHQELSITTVVFWSGSFGFLIVVLLGMLAATFRAPWHWWTAMPAATVAALVASRIMPLRRELLRVLASTPAPGSVAIGAATTVTAVVVVLVLSAFHDVSVPPHVHDPSNHAFMTSRIAQTGSTASAVVFGEPYGAPPQPYLAGWHAVVALITSLGGLPAWWSTWALALAATALLPVTWTVLWRSWGLPPIACAAAVTLLVANNYAPLPTFAAGLWSMLVGAAALPAVTLLLAWWVRRGNVVSAVLAGLALLVAVHLHASMAWTAVLLTPITVMTSPSPRWQVKPASMAVLLAILLVGLVVPLAMTAVGYARLETHPPTAGRLGGAIESYLNALGRWDLLKVALLGGLIVGLRRRRWRPIVVTSLLFGVVLVFLVWGRDPVSRWFSLPYYMIPERLRFVQLLLLPPLGGLALWTTWNRWTRPAVRAMLVVVALAVIVVPGTTMTWRYLAGRDAHTGFGPSEVELANRLPELVAPGAWVANAWDDGSCWAAHLSGVPMTSPACWHFGAGDGLDFRAGTAGLLARPWPPATRRLQARQVTHVWVSDDKGWDPPRLRWSCAEFDADPRFTAQARSERSAVYRIEWDTEF